MAVSGTNSHSSCSDGGTDDLGCFVSQELGMDTSEAVSSCVMCKVAFGNSRKTRSGKREIKVLVCLHSACGACLESSLRNGREVMCPICDASSGETDYNKYLCNFAVHQGIDSKAIEEKSRMTCDECVESCEAVKYCKECMRSLCCECAEHHARSRVTRTHILTTLGENQYHRAAFCPIHVDKWAEFFCEDCNVMCCRECIIAEHENHAYKLPSGNLVQRQREVVKDQIAELKALARVLQEGHQSLTTMIEDLDDKMLASRGSIAQFKELITAKITERRGDLREAVSSCSAKNYAFLKKECAGLEASMASIWQAVDFAGKVLGRGTNIEVLLMKSALSNHPMLHKKSVGATDGRSGKPPDSWPRAQWHGDIEKLMEVIKNVGMAAMAEPDRSLERRRCADMNAGSCKFGLPTSLPLAPPDGVPKPAGLHLRSNEELQQFGLGPRRALLGTEGASPGRFRSPCGMAVDSRHVYVADTLNCRIQVFDRWSHGLKGQIEWPVDGGVGGLQDPSGLAAFGDGRLTVVEYSVDRLLFVEMVPDSLRVARATVLEEKHLYGPFGVGVSRSRLVVADSCNYRCLVMDMSGRILLEFGSRGYGPGQFESPDCVATFVDGSIAVSDKDNHRVQVFDPVGNFVNYIPSGWSPEMALAAATSSPASVPPGQLRGPMGMCCDRQDRLYICDCGSNRIQIFTRAGHWLWSSDHPTAPGLRCTFQSPTGMAIDNEGRIYVASDHCVQVF